MVRKMKVFMTCFVLGSLLGIISSPSPAQQHQSSQHLTQEIETLKKRVLELEKKLKVVENAEKMELQAKLAEVNIRLLNAEFAKFDRELRDSNNEWLRTWSHWFLSIIGVFIAMLIAVGAVFWFWLKSTTNQLIADRVEKSLNGFRDALKELGLLKNQLGELEREHTVSILEDYFSWPLHDEHDHPQPIKVLRDETLWVVLADKRYAEERHVLQVKCKAAEVLAARRSPKLLSATLELFNSILDSESEIDFGPGRYLKHIANLLGQVPTLDAYNELTGFLNRILTENPRHSDLFLTGIVFSLADISLELNKGNSVAMLRKAGPHLNPQGEHDGLILLAKFFDRFNEPKGIEDLLNHHGTSLASDEIEKCLELLAKYGPQFVEKWRSQHTTEDRES